RRRAEAVDGGAVPALEVVRAPDVDGHCQRLAAGRAHRVGGLVQRGGGTGADRHARALAGERDRRGTSEPLRSGRDHGGAAADAEIHGEECSSTAASATLSRPRALLARTRGATPANAAES